MSYRIGIGYDIHRLVEGRKLFLAGLEIPYVKGLLGYSDADVVLHALCDALLGAVGLPDIGEQFPDTDPGYHNASSQELLKAVDDLVKKKSYLIENLDIVVILEEPILSPFKKQMRKIIAGILKIEEGCVNIKAKTNEGLGDIGRKAAIASWAAVLLKQKE